MNVYVLQHVHTRDNGEEDVKFIGVYSTREKARAAVERLSLQPGFSESPDGFSVDDYHVDHDQWVEGFVEIASV